jgi:hypothetical protein
MVRVGGFAYWGTWAWNSAGTCPIVVRMLARGMTTTNFASSFFSKYLFARNPTIIVNEIDPIFEDVQTLTKPTSNLLLSNKIKDVPEVSIPFPDLHQVKSLIPTEGLSEDGVMIVIPRTSRTL